MDEKSIEVYRNIKAPEHLKERILTFDNRKKSNRNLRTVATIAACFLLLVGFVGTMLTNTSNAGIYLEGQKVGSDPVLISLAESEENNLSMARIQEENTISMSLKVEDEMTVEVSDGFVRLESEEDTFSNEGTQISLTKDCQIDWVIGELTSANLIVTTKKTVMYYEMYQDETSKQYYLKRKGTEKL